MAWRTKGPFSESLKGGIYDRAKGETVKASLLTEMKKG
jgi:hypothetical protein